MSIQFNPVNSIQRGKNVSFQGTGLNVAQRVVKTVVRETVSIGTGIGLFSLGGSAIFGPAAIPFFALWGGISTKLIADAVGHGNKEVLKYVSDGNVFKIGGKIAEKVRQIIKK